MAIAIHMQATLLAGRNERVGIVLNTMATSEQYEAADRDFFVYRSIILHDKTEEAFLVRIRRWLEFADSALRSEPFLTGVKITRCSQKASGKPLITRPRPS